MIAASKINTTEAGVIEDNARDILFDKTDDRLKLMPLLNELNGRSFHGVVAILNDDFEILERNFLKVLRKYTDITFRDEGHMMKP